MAILSTHIDYLYIAFMYFRSSICEVICTYNSLLKCRLSLIDRDNVMRFRGELYRNLV